MPGVVKVELGLDNNMKKVYCMVLAMSQLWVQFLENGWNDKAYNLNHTVCAIDTLNAMWIALD